jgi:hypothetical protein
MLAVHDKVVFLRFFRWAEIPEPVPAGTILSDTPPRNEPAAGGGIPQPVRAKEISASGIKS